MALEIPGMPLVLSALSERPVPCELPTMELDDSEAGSALTGGGRGSIPTRCGPWRRSSAAILSAAISSTAISPAAMWSAVISAVTPALIAVGAAGFGVACASGSAIEYPDVQLATPKIELHVDDVRHETREIIGDRGPLERDERDSFAERFPTDAFVPRVQARLDALASQGHQPLDVEVTVERADVTFFSKYRDEFVRYDVTLRVVTKARSGELLNRGRTSAWRQIPKEKATTAARLDAHVGAALDAFDRYFSDESRLEHINENLAALEKTRQAQ